MGVVFQDTWEKLGDVLIKNKKTYSLTSLSKLSGVNALDVHRIILELKRQGLITMFKLSNQVVIESDLSSRKQVLQAYENYMIKYHGLKMGK